MPKLILHTQRKFLHCKELAEGCKTISFLLRVKWLILCSFKKDKGKPRFSKEIEVDQEGKGGEKDNRMILKI